MAKKPRERACHCGACWRCNQYEKRRVLRGKYRQMVDTPGVEYVKLLLAKISVHGLWREFKAKRDASRVNVTRSDTGDD